MTSDLNEIARRLAKAQQFESNPPRPEQLMAYRNHGLGIRKPRILDAIRINSLPAVQALVRTHRDADWQLHKGGGMTSPLMLATRAGAHDIIEFLLSKGACPTQLHRALDFEHSPLYMACQLGDAHAVLLMLESGCDLTNTAYKSDGGLQYSGVELLAEHKVLITEINALSEERNVRQACRQGGNAPSARRL